MWFAKIVTKLTCLQLVTAWKQQLFRVLLGPTDLREPQTHHTAVSNPQLKEILLI